MPVQQDYRSPIEVSQDSRSYTVMGFCGNCGVKVLGTFPLGEEANQPGGRACPECGCRTVHFRGLLRGRR